VILKKEALKFKQVFEIYNWMFKL